MYQFYVHQVELMAAMCLNRNYLGIWTLEGELTYEVCTAATTDSGLPLELRAALSEVKLRSRSVKLHGQRYLHLVDSNVALGILTKKRSSSYLLQRVIAKLNTLELASGVFPIYAFIRSAHNPADYASRSPARWQHSRRLGSSSH